MKILTNITRYYYPIGAKLHYNGKVVFAHRPPEYWDGKDIITGKVTRNYPKTYDDYDVKREIRDILRTPYEGIRKDIVNTAAHEICKHVKLVVDNPIKDE